MGKYEDLINKHGTVEQFKEKLKNAATCYEITDVQAMIEVKRYEEMLEEAKLLDSKVITIPELRIRKEKHDRDKIIKKLLDDANKLKW